MFFAILVILTLVALKRGWGNWVFLPLGISCVLHMGCSTLCVTPADIREASDYPIGTIWAGWNDFGLVNVLAILVLLMMAIAGKKQH